MRAAAGAGGIAAVSLALVATGVLGGRADAASGCSGLGPITGGNNDFGPGVAFSGPPNPPFAKPAATVGVTQTLYWTPEPDSYWLADGVTTNGGDGGFAYRVNITNLTTCAVHAFNVPGVTASSFTVTTSDFLTVAAADAIDGTTFAYRLSATETAAGPLGGQIDGNTEQTYYSDQSAAVVSLQAATAPVLQSFTLDNGLAYTNQLTVPVELAATDPLPAGAPAGSAAPGLGYAEFSASRNTV